MFKLVSDKIEHRDTGFFGPNSHLWLNHQHMIRALGYPVAVIIIASNPVVFEIISKNIRTPRDLKNRLSITKEYSFSFIFGDTFTALSASQALRKAHQKINHPIDGVLRSPLEPELMLWVFSTIYYTSKKMNELLLKNIPFNEQTYEEYKILAQLYGISEQYLPLTMQDFEKYWTTMLNKNLIFTNESQAYIKSLFQLSIADIILNQKFPKKLLFIFKPIDKFIRIFCIYLLPEKIAESFDLHLSKKQYIGMKLILKCIRWLHSILPKQFKIENKTRNIFKQYCK